MPKLKTHKGTASRINVTGTGRLRHGRIGRRHLNTGKSAKRMRALRKPADVPAVVEHHIRRLLPYTA